MSGTTNPKSVRREIFNTEQQQPFVDEALQAIRETSPGVVAHHARSQFVNARLVACTCIPCETPQRELILETPYNVLCVIMMQL